VSFVPHARRFPAATILLVLLIPAAATAEPRATWEFETLGGLSHQSYSADDLDESVLARSLELRLTRRGEGGWISRLDLAHGEDLYLGTLRGGLDLSYFGPSFELVVDTAIERYTAGRMTDPLLYFDPDSLESQAASSAAYRRSGGTAGLGWRSLGWDLRAEAEYRSLDYDEPSEILSDQRELILAGRLGLLLPAELHASLDAGYRRRRCLDRLGGDRGESELDLRLSRDLPRGELALLGTFEGHAPDHPTEVAYYERPEGESVEVGAELLLFVDRADGHVALRSGREDWQALPGAYFRSGGSIEAELAGNLRLGGEPYEPALQLDLFALVARFEPDSLTSTDDLARGRELRWELGLRGDIKPRGRFPVGVGLFLEDLRLESDLEDRYLLVRYEWELGWRARPTLCLRGTMSLDQYSSRYGDVLDGEDETESERSLGGSLALEWEHGPWRWEARVRSQVYYSFLEPDATSRDWESGLWIRWHP